MLAAYLVVTTAPYLGAQSSPDPKAFMRIDAGLGSGQFSHHYRGPSGGNEFVEGVPITATATLTFGRTWAVYLDYGQYFADHDPSFSDDGDFDFYAVDLPHFITYTVGAGYQYHYRFESWYRGTVFFGAGVRIAGVRNDTGDRVPAVAQVADFASAIGLDVRLRSYWWPRSWFGPFVGFSAGVDFAALQDADFAFDRGGSYSFTMLGVAFRIP